MGGNEVLTVGEFKRGVERIERRFDSLDNRLTDQLQDHAERLAVLEADNEKDRRALQRERRNANKKTIAWGSAISGGVLIVIEVVQRLSAALGAKPPVP